MVGRLEYLEYFLDSVDFVTSGRKGSISENKWLITNYDSSFYGILEKQLKNRDDRVRYEIVILLTTLKERAASGIVAEMRLKDNERVGRACLGYLTSMGEDDSLIPELMETLEFGRGTEFMNAAKKIGSVGTEDDVPALRRIYGQVNDDRRQQVRDALIKIIERNPELRRKRDLLLSVPVFPDETKFRGFLKSSEDYLNVRYAEKIQPRKKISMETHNNIVRGIRTIRVRLYNEHDNLQHYDQDLTERYNDLVDSLSATVKDLASKEIYESSGVSGISCEVCGSDMVFNGERWRCIDCGNLR